MAGKYLIITQKDGNRTVTDKALKDFLKENDYPTKSTDIEGFIENGTTLKTIHGEKFWIDETYRG